MPTKQEILSNLKEVPRTLPVNPDGIPQELKDVPQWVCWWWRGKDKWTKVPVDAKTGGNADITDPAYLRTFDQAMAYYQQHSDTIAGVGFVFTEGDPYCGVDFDDTDDAAPALALRSYAERSPSGTGFKVFVKAKLADGAKNRKGNMEVYDHKRYFTLTGCRVEGAPATIEERQSEIDGLLPKETPRTPPPGGAPNTGGTCELSDDEIITLGLGERTDKFRRLFDGDLTGYGQDDSRADEALCCKIAFYTRDPEQIDRVFRRSKLYREKWDRPDYRARTINAALSHCTEVYQPTPLHLTDAGNAGRLVKKYGEEIRYCRLWEKWITWDGDRWRVGNVDGVVLRMKSVVRSMFREASAEHAAAAKEIEALAAVSDEAEKAAAMERIGGRANRAKKKLDWALKSESAARIMAAVELTKCEVPITPDEFDTDPFLLNCPNGTVDLRTGQLRPHRRADYITQLCPTRYDQKATCPTWEKFLRDIFARDEKMIVFIQRLLGYGLTGSVSERILPIFYGGGANGKSTLLNTFTAVLGDDYARPAPASLLMCKRNESHPTEIASLFRKRFVSCIETKDGARMNEELIKQLTGNDKLTARRMREDFWDFDPTHKLVVATNHKPQVLGQDDAIWDRIRLVPFNVRFAEDQRDKELPQKLLAEAPGILAWAVAGCVAWWRDGLQTPPQVRAATSECRTEEDRIGEFIEEECVPEGTEKLSSLYKRYAERARDRGEYPLSNKRFAQALDRFGYEKHKSHGITVYHAVSLRPQYGATLTSSVGSPFVATAGADTRGSTGRK
jgi:putative DNA primase/helicase